MINAKMTYEHTVCECQKPEMWELFEVRSLVLAIGKARVPEDCDLAMCVSLNFMLNILFYAHMFPDSELVIVTKHLQYAKVGSLDSKG